MTTRTVDLWRRLHALADPMPLVPDHLRTHVELLVDHIERLVDGTDDTPTPKKGSTP